MNLWLDCSNCTLTLCGRSGHCTPCRTSGKRRSPLSARRRRRKLRWLWPGSSRRRIGRTRRFKGYGNRARSCGGGAPWWSRVTHAHLLLGLLGPGSGHKALHHEPMPHLHPARLSPWSGSPHTTGAHPRIGPPTARTLHHPLAAAAMPRSSSTLTQTVQAYIYR